LQPVVVRDGDADDEGARHDHPIQRERDRRDWASACHICTRTEPTAATLCTGDGCARLSALRAAGSGVPRAGMCGLWPEWKPALTADREEACTRQAGSAACVWQAPYSAAQRSTLVSGCRLCWQADTTWQCGNPPQHAHRARTYRLGTQWYCEY
jgi:hypothetical protein